MTSAFLDARRLGALATIGDLYCPGDELLPAFSELGCAEHVDRILRYLPEHDRADLVELLGVLGRLPAPLARGLVRLVTALALLPGAPGALFRKARFGLRGIVLSLYYSGEVGRAWQGPSPLQVLGYEVGVAEDPRDGDQP